MNPKGRKLSYSLSLPTSATPSQQPLSCVNTETGAKEDGNKWGQTPQLRQDRADAGRSGSTDLHTKTGTAGRVHPI